MQIEVVNVLRTDHVIDTVCLNFTPGLASSKSVDRKEETVCELNRTHCGSPGSVVQHAARCRFFRASYRVTRSRVNRDPPKPTSSARNEKKRRAGAQVRDQLRQDLDFRQDPSRDQPVLLPTLASGLCKVDNQGTTCNRRQAQAPRLRSRRPAQHGFRLLALCRHECFWLKNQSNAACTAIGPSPAVQVPPTSGPNHTMASSILTEVH